MPVLILAALLASACGPASALPHQPDVRFGPPQCTTSTMAWIGTAPFTSLQDALDASVADDVIEICPGVWQLPAAIVYREPHTLSIVGTAQDPAGTTIMAPPNDAGGVFFGRSGPLAIRNMTFVGGLSGFGNWSIYGISEDQRAESFVLEDVVLVSTGIELQNINECTVLHATFNDSSMGFLCISSNVSELNASHSSLGFYSEWWEPIPISVRIDDSTFHSLESSAPFVSVRPGRPSAHDVVITGTEFIGRRALDVWSGGTADTIAAVAIYGNTDADTPPTTVQIEDCVFDDNAAGLASHLQLNNRWGESPIDATITRTAFWRGAWSNEGPTQYWLSRYPEFGAAVRADYGDFGVTMRFEDVDFGTGETENLGLPIHNCLTRYSGIFTGTVNAIPELTRWEDQCP